MPEFVDQLQNRIHLKEAPRRVISLVPSQSEFLWEIGLRSELVGISKFCIHPEEMFRKVGRVGGTKELDIEKIRALKPDLVIGNREENEKDQIEALRSFTNVWMSDIVTFTDAFNMMSELGELLGRKKQADELVKAIRISLSKTKGAFNGQRVAYFIWNRPYMFAAANTFIDHVLSHLGFRNALGSLERYPRVEIEDLHNAEPELCFLSSEPFPFKDIHARMIRELLPESKVLLVDGEVFSWYGSRLLKLGEYVNDLKMRIENEC